MFVSALWCQDSNRVTYCNANEAGGWKQDGSFSTRTPLRVVVTVELSCLVFGSYVLVSLAQLTQDTDAFTFGQETRSLRFCQ